MALGSPSDGEEKYNYDPNYVRETESPSPPSPSPPSPPPLRAQGRASSLDSQACQCARPRDLSRRPPLAEPRGPFESRLAIGRWVISPDDIWGSIEKSSFARDAATPLIGCRASVRRGRASGRVAGTRSGGEREPQEVNKPRTPRRPTTPGNSEDQVINQ